MSFGALSFFYKELKNDQKSGVEDKKVIANYFGLHHKRFGSWLHVLTYVRNICAHHGRLWNRELAIRPDKVKHDEWSPLLTPRNDRIFYVLLMLRHLLSVTGSRGTWATEVSDLLETVASMVSHRLAMGLPENWRAYSL